MEPAEGDAKTELTLEDLMQYMREQREYMEQRFGGIEQRFGDIEQRFHQQQAFNEHVQRSLEEINQRRSGRSSRANSEIIQADQLSEIPFEESKSDGHGNGEQPVAATIERREQQYIDPELLHTRIENAVREGVLNATQALRSEEERPPVRPKRQTIQEALREIDRQPKAKVTLTKEDDSYLEIRLSEITLDGFLVFLERIAEFEKCRDNGPIPSVFTLLEGRAKEMIRFTLMELYPDDYTEPLECIDASVTRVIEAAKYQFRPLDMMDFNSMLLESCLPYRVTMDKLEDFRRVDEDLCILETKFNQRYDFLEEAAKMNKLDESIPLVTTKRGGSLEQWMSLIPACMRDTTKRLMRSENFPSVKAFLKEFFKQLKITRDLSLKYNQFRSRFNFRTKSSAVDKRLHQIEQQVSDSESVSDEEQNVLKHEEDLYAAEVLKSSPCFRELTQDGGCKDKSCKFSHDKAVLTEALKKMTERVGLTVMPKPSINAPPQRRYSNSPAQLKRYPGDRKRPGDVRILTRDQPDVEEVQQGDDNPLDDL